MLRFLRRWPCRHPIISPCGLECARWLPGSCRERNKNINDKKNKKQAQFQEVAGQHWLPAALNICRLYREVNDVIANRHEPALRCFLHKYQNTFDDRRLHILKRRESVKLQRPTGSVMCCESFKKVLEVWYCKSVWNLSLSLGRSTL